MAIATKTLRLFREIARKVAPPPRLTVSEWADEYRRLSPEASAEPGRWRTSRTPYLRGIMDAANDTNVQTIVVMSSAQVGKTELLLNMIGYYIDYDPSPIMMVQPTEHMAEAYSKDRLAPMFRDSPSLRSKVKDVKSKDSGNTILHKKFPGGQLTMGGANSPAGLASRPIRIVLLDEVDRYPVSAGSEGDPVELVSKRTTTFTNRKRVLVSTPTIKGASRIEVEYLDSTMEQWCLPCPSCGEYQPLDFDRLNLDDAKMRCIECGFGFLETEWKANQQAAGKWVARKEHSSSRGFHLNELASPWKRWPVIIEEYRKAKESGDETLKVWTNTSKGESWEIQGEQVEEEALLERCEEYAAEVPDAVHILTASVDVQKDRLECEVVGWGLAAESWGVEYRKFYGDPAQPLVWIELDQYLDRQFRKFDGSLYSIAATCIDSGGHHTSEVYKFCKPRESRRVYAIKGQGGEGIPLVKSATRTNYNRCLLFQLGVDEGKGKVLDRLKKDEPGPGYCHYPKGRGYDEEYFRGLTAEKRVLTVKQGKPTIAWVKKATGRRNEPLDLRNYATAALAIINPNYDQLDQPLTAQLPKKKRRRRGVISKGAQ